MAEFYTEDEESQLDIYLIEDIAYWIGLNDIESEGTWNWSESDTTPVYTNWDYNEPNNLAGNEDCVRKSYKSSKWLDWNCEANIANDYKIHALCQLNSE